MEGTLLDKFEKDGLLTELRNMPVYRLNGRQRERVLEEARKRTIAGRERRTLRSIGWPVFTAAVCLGLVFLLFSIEPKEEAGKTAISNGILYDRYVKDGRLYQKDALFGDDRVRLLAPMEWVAGDTRNISKMFVYLYGEDMDFEQKQLKIIASNGREDIVLAEEMLSPPLEQETAHVKTGFPAIPSPGRWVLTFFVGDELYTGFGIQVKQEYPKSGGLTILTSSQDFRQGRMDDIRVDFHAKKRPPEEIVFKAKKEGDSTEKTFVFQLEAEYEPNGDYQNAMYAGMFEFDRPGIWLIEGAGEKLKVNVK